MRRNLIVGAVWFALWPGLAAQSQTSDFDGWEALLRSDYVHNPDEVEIKSFSVTSSAEVRHLIDEARAALVAGRADQAARYLQQTLDQYPNHLYEVARGHYL